MKQIYIISGYGVPKDILVDGHYTTYLRIAFNKIYRNCVEGKAKNPIIVLTGGRTDMVKPYRRTEAGEMAKVFRGLMVKGEAPRITKTWKLLLEPKAISSLENMEFPLAILRRRGIRAGRVTIFMEQTRMDRVLRVARRVFPKAFLVHAAPIDFDVSANRYLDPAFLEKKNALALKHDLWALRSPENHKEHHRVYLQRLKFLRKAGSQQHIKAVKKWWDQEMKRALAS